MKHEEPVKTKSPSLKVSEDNLIDLDFDTDPRPSISQSATASISNDYDRPDLDDRYSTWVLYQIMDFTNSSDDLRFDRARKLLEIHKPKDQNLQREIQNLIDLHEKKIQP